MMPLFSIIIPLYNKENYICKTIQSVLNQTISDFELIIINDASTDNSYYQAKIIKDDRIRFFDNKIKEGLSKTRNIGIQFAEGKIIALLDADDIWMPDFLKNIKKLYTDFPIASIYGTDYSHKYAKNIILKTKINISSKLKFKSFLLDNFFEANMHHPILCPSSMAFKKDIFINQEVFDVSITYAEDIDFYIKYCSKYKVAYCYKPLIEKNFNVENQITRNKISDKTLPDLDIYESWTQSIPELKKYLDLYRYIFAYQLLLEGDYVKKDAILAHIDYNNLNIKQKIILNCPKKILILIQRLKSFLLLKGIRITTL